MTDQATPAKVRLTDGLGPLVDSEEDHARLWAEIHTLRSAVAGPAGYATWQDAAVAERVRRVKAEARIDLGKYAGAYGGYTTEPPKPRTLWQRFQAWRERTGFLMDGRDGGM
ncbi:MAG TPA: hypothetical protein PKV98_07860 [Burkholderiaceae bacterium]|nr:hypothetical protein [Burkholderiaceae bacterium]